MSDALLFDRRRCQGATRRAEQHLQERRGAQRSKKPSLHNEREGVRRGLAEQEGGAWVLGRMRSGALGAMGELELPNVNFEAQRSVSVH